MRLINEIVVHCTATNPKWYASKSAEDVVAEIRRWHTEERGWSDIGYHAIVHRDGSVAHGRSDDRKGAHVAGRNSTTIGISLVGGRGGVANGKFEDNFTPEQDAALRNQTSQLRARKEHGHSTLRCRPQIVELTQHYKDHLITVRFSISGE